MGTQVLLLELTSFSRSFQSAGHNSIKAVENRPKNQSVLTSSLTSSSLGRTRALSWINLLKTFRSWAEVYSLSEESPSAWKSVSKAWNLLSSSSQSWETFGVRHLIRKFSSKEGFSDPALAFQMKVTRSKLESALNKTVQIKPLPYEKISVPFNG